MKRIAFRVVPVAALLVAGVAWLGPRAAGQSSPMPSTKNGDWPMYTADIHGSKYSPLDQINASNFSKMEVAWRFKTDNLGPRPETKLEGTPIKIGDTVYATAGTRRAVVALNASTGEQKWMYAMDEGERATRWAPRQLSGRGLSYWTDGKGDDRVIYVTTGYRLVSLNAKTGQPIAGFGDKGVVDLKVGVYIGKDKQIDLEKGEIGLHSTAARRQRHDHRRLVDVRGPRLRLQHQRQGPGARLRRPHRQADLAVQHHPEAGRVRQRDVGERFVGVDRQRRRLDPDHRRPGSRPRLPAGRDADDRRIRRQPPRQQPVRREHRRGRPQDRQAQVALPVRAPRAVGPRHVGLAAW